MKERWGGWAVVLIIIALLFVPLISAGFFGDLWGKMTGQATRNVGLNISVAVAKITYVENNSASAKSIATTLNSGPAFTSILINFSAYQAAGQEYLNDSTATVNISFFSTLSESRVNSTCSMTEKGTLYKNYTCNVSFWWYDSAGSWGINASILDNFSIMASNKTMNISIPSLTGFDSGPANLTLPSIGPGSYNSTSNNDPLVLNNTGNQYVNISINATDLVGETTPSLRLYSGNFSMSTFTGGACSGGACLECVGNQMNKTSGNYVNITEGNLTRGNYTINTGNTNGQEGLYLCLRYAGSELTSQSYSIASQGSWTIRI
ncbi:MAG: hypothetical protein Q7S06_00195 [Nanoarchaeota archaeon]|nr:hypothetical protein [Nanoarchaeota archaeon]